MLSSVSRSRSLVRSCSSCFWLVPAQDIDHERKVLSPEGAKYASEGTPEAHVFEALPADGSAASLDDLKARLGAAEADAGFRQAMTFRWIAVERPPKKEGEGEGEGAGASGEGSEAKPKKEKKKKGKGEPAGPVFVKRAVSSIEDATVRQLLAVLAGEELPAKDLNALKRRKLVAIEQWKTYALSKGPEFAPVRVKAVAELTAEDLRSGAWRERRYKPLNFDAAGAEPAGGALHPLCRVRTAMRSIFLQMGFEEMATNNWVESGFWNFDALFQPQQHPARDAHDTFFLTAPQTTPLESVPRAYAERVRRTHERGGYGSAGYGYAWSAAEAEKNLLRTHTTAVSSRVLYRLAREPVFRPVRCFSIDRVFRNEAVDRTHLAEFHQVEGLVADRGLSLGHLIGTLRAFFARLGMDKLRFKPAYNPYTEPSMEIFAYSEELGKWIEVGNSGMFRPEMLRPMGLPEDVSVAAWGLSLERPTMILYGIDNIRDLFGHKVSLTTVQTNPLCRIGL